MKRALRWLALSGVMAGVLLLSGCATSYVLDNNVQSFSTLTGVPAARIATNNRDGNYTRWAASGSHRLLRSPGSTAM